MSRRMLLLGAVALVGGCHLLLVSEDNRYETSPGGGATGGAAASGGAGGDQGGGGATPSCAPIVFDAAAITPSCPMEQPGQSESWIAGSASRWAATDGDPDSVIELCGEQLRIVPGKSDDWWFKATAVESSHKGPFVHQRVCGPFAMVGTMAAQLPSHSMSQYNGVAFAVVDPNDGDHWVLFSHGHQDLENGNLVNLGTKIWPTVGDVTSPSGFSSVHPSDNTGGTFALCRLEDGTFEMFRSTEGDGSIQNVTTPFEGGANTYGFDQPDGCCVDVGLTAHHFLPGPTAMDTVVGVHGHVRFFDDITNASSCREALEDYISCEEDGVDCER